MRAVFIELDDEMKRIELEILQILPEDYDRSMAIIIHLKKIMGEMKGVTDEFIIERGNHDDTGR